MCLTTATTTTWFHVLMDENINSNNLVSCLDENIITTYVKS